MLPLSVLLLTNGLRPIELYFLKAYLFHSWGTKIVITKYDWYLLYYHCLELFLQATRAVPFPCIVPGTPEFIAVYVFFHTNIRALVDLFTGVKIPIRIEEFLTSVQLV